MGASNDMIGERFLAASERTRSARRHSSKGGGISQGAWRLAPIAGVVALLDYAERRGLPRAVVTNAPRANADQVLAALGLAERLPIGSSAPSSRARSPTRCPISRAWS